MQVEQTAIDNAKQIAALWESVKSAHHRINENDKITAGIHELATSIATIAAEIKALTAKLDESTDRIESGQRAQGQRIGKIEQTLATIERDEETIKDHEDRLDAIEKAPAAKWDKFIWLVFTAVVGAILGAIFTYLSK